MDRLKNKIALITGAATGIGLSAARRFIEEGAAVVLCDSNEKDGQAAADELGDQASFISLDVTRLEDWTHAMQQVLSRHKRLDILINNAGILGTCDHQNIEDTDLTEWRLVNAVNTEGVFLGCQAAVKAMKENGGSIVNISSIAAMVGTPTLVAYGASKAAVRQLTKTVAIHCANKKYGIRCNSVHPDPVKTNMGDALMSMYGGDIRTGWENIPNRVPLGVAAEAVDIANCILFLASDEARHLTGSELVVDGGLTAI
ncbi:MAG: 3-beta hydroxysteroid dehydrogenase [Sneathiella sp.]|nr:MAG: 3-beta hydroxysteroid dehydrogenase [Sneathiella sp.]